MINVDRLRQWTDTLRATTLNQSVGALAEVNQSGYVTGACCLGIGEIECAGASVVIDSSDHYPAVIIDDQRDPGLPHLFPAWLGIEMTSQTSDLYLDTAPVFQRVIADTIVNEDTGLVEVYTINDTLISASWLNDEARLTFPQIADMVDYFGIRS